MKKNNIITMGIIVILMLGGLLFWWFISTKPTLNEINSAAKVVAPVDSNIFTNTTTQKIEARKTFGNIPVQISDDYHHNQLF